MANGIENQWIGSLSISPDRARYNDQVTLTFSLSQPGFDGLPASDRAQVYKMFTYACTSSNNSLQQTLNIHPTFTERNNATGQGIQVLFAIPDVPDSDYDIAITATPNAGPFPFGLAPPPEAVVGSNTLSVITRLFETESKVTLQRTFAAPTKDRALWAAIRNRTAAIGFDRYKRFIDSIFCEKAEEGPHFARAKEFREQIRQFQAANKKNKNKDLNIHGPYAYSVLTLATQVFLTLESGVVINDSGQPEIFDIEKERIRVNAPSLTLADLQGDLVKYLEPSGGNLPYLNRVLDNLITLDDRPPNEVLPYCDGVLQFRLSSPSLIELIWSYWLEEGMLVQTWNAIARRFQNRRGSSHDPLAELEFDPLRPLNNLIWGFVQTEQNRLTVPRRAHEYVHHYGLSLVGKAVSDLNPADVRSKFIEAFHNLLAATARFYKEDSDTTVIADAFPLLTALKDVHLILAEGAHNQFGDLTWTARGEMMTIQWMLARDEMKEFLRGRYMVPYQEGWMGAVDSMKKLQGWTDTTITHFYELAVTGERILLSIRYGDWSDIENIEDQAKNWARSWKPEIQRYIYAYQAVAGVDLSSDVVDSRDAATRYLQPSSHLQRRLAEQASTVRLRSPAAPDLVTSRTSMRIETARAGQPKLAAPRDS
jgi:hypothetical protein